MVGWRKRLTLEISPKSGQDKMRTMGAKRWKPLAEIQENRNGCQCQGLRNRENKGCDLAWRKISCCESGIQSCEGQGVARSHLSISFKADPVQGNLI